MVNITELFVAFVLCIAIVSGEITSRPAESIIDVGDSAEFMCHTTSPITKCLITVTGATTVELSPDHNSNKYGFFYKGNGLDKGDCGVEIKFADEKYNGNVSCQLTLQNGNVESANMKLVIGKEPSLPTFKPLIKKNYTAGDQLEVKCVVADGRPAANISWFMDDKPITDGLDKPEIIDGENGLQTISQLFKKKLDYKDHDQKLKCVASHFAFGGLKQRSITSFLNVNFPFIVESKVPIKIYGIKIGDNVTINLIIISHPLPTFKWYMNEKTIDRSDHFVPEIIPFEDESDKYTISLSILSITKEDMAKKYKVELNNTLSHGTYDVELTTDAEGGMSTGAIIAIIIIAFVIIILIVLCLYARAKKLWCFRR